MRGCCGAAQLVMHLKCFPQLLKGIRQYYFWNVYVVIPRKSSGLICSWEVEAKKDLCAKLDPFAAVKLHDLEVQAMNLINCRDNEGTVITCSSFD